MSTPRPLALIILDGFGYSKTIEHNAIRHAKTPHWDELWKNSPHLLISGSGEAVGLPSDQMGNSEVGHLNLGAGRVVYQEFSRISKAIKDGDFFENAVIKANMDKVIQAGKAVHIMGLLSPGGVHSHQDHLVAALQFAAKRGAKHLYVHAILDGRDTPPKSALASLKLVEKTCKALKVGKIISVTGRYYTMDRDKRWDRIQQGYDVMTAGKAPFSASTAEEALTLAYERGETDEFVKPTSIHAKGKSPILIHDGDMVLFMNFRADRARQITQAFIDKNFKEFERKSVPKLSAFVCLTQYDANFVAPVAYPSVGLTNIFGECVANHGLKQLRIAETEKYAHVTFFFNGGVEKPFPGEDRELIPSPKIATYDLQPEMSALLVTEKLVAAIKSKKYDCIICNYANADMVGHTGNFEATIKAIEVLDDCVGKIINALQSVGGEMILTADHGNADCMYDDEIAQTHTAHTSNPVPFVYMGRSAKTTRKKGVLADVSPTLLYLMGLPIPHEMTGKPLVELTE